MKLLYGVVECDKCLVNGEMMAAMVAQLS